MKFWLMLVNSAHEIKWIKNPESDNGFYTINDRHYAVRPGTSFRRTKRVWWTFFTKKEVIEYVIYGEGSPEPFTLKGVLDDAVKSKTQGRLKELNRSRLVSDMLGESGFNWSTFLFGAMTGLAFGIIGGILSAHYLLGK
jgi:hypothetical protein